MTDSTPEVRPVTVTLDLTNDAVHAVLVGSLREAARAATARADQEGESYAPDAEWAEEQERLAQIALDLVQSIEEQRHEPLDTASTDRP
jgi:hypothetical protein